MGALKRKAVEVLGLYRRDGSIVPTTIVVDGSQLPVTLLRVTPMSETKQGGNETRYEISIRGNRVTLYLEDAKSYTSPRRWFRELS